MQLRHVASREGRLSSFLKQEMGMSTGLMNRLKWKNVIFINGLSQHTDYPVKTGDVITVALEAEEPEYPAEDGHLTILYEDDHLLAVQKPAGMLIHPSHSRNTGTLANLVAGYYRRTGQKCAFHPVTRLDRDTYGVVLLAKNPHIHAAMNVLHARREIRKTYHALVYGVPPVMSGTIDVPIARKPRPSLLREISPEGKPSVTEYRVLEVHDGYTKVALRPVTGRTHQLRLHCAYVGCPILGDPQYSSLESAAFSAGFGLESQALCAVSLEFTHPVTGEALLLRGDMDAQLPR